MKKKIDDQMNSNGDLPTDMPNWDSLEEVEKRRKIMSVMSCGGSWELKMELLEQIFNGDKKVTESYNQKFNS
jgi:hypothetical protein